MKIQRRDFLRASGLGIASLVTSRHWVQVAGQEEPQSTVRAILTWGSNGHGEGQFDIPIAVAVNKKDEILVTDFRQSDVTAKSRVQRFDQEGRFLAAFETDPLPGGMALDKEGLLFVTHMMNHKVAVYDPAGKLVREFGKLGSAPGEFDQPGGIAFGPDGSVYVADQVNRRMQRLTPQGEPISEWGKFGTATGEFGGNSNPKSRGGGPHFVAFDSHENLYTTEASLGRVQKFKADGTFVLAWGDNEVGPGHFGGHSQLPGPLAIAVDGKDQVWVTSTNQYVHQFTADGQFVCRVGGAGPELGQFRLPHGLAFDSQQFLYVADARNSRIQKLST